MTTQKISEKEALELYSDLIAPDIIKLENAKDKDKNKRHKILEFKISFYWCLFALQRCTIRIRRKYWGGRGEQN